MQKRVIKLAAILLSVLSQFIYFMPVTKAQIDTVRPQILDGVDISTQRLSGEATLSRSHVGKNEIQDKQGNGSINNILDQVPGMITTSDAGTGLGYSYMRIRGIDQTRINVTVNGIALNDAESQGSWFVNLPDFGSGIENMEVQRGAGTSNNGSSAFGATMNFTTLSPATNPYAEISSSAGSFYTFRNTIRIGTGLIKKRFSAQAGYSNVLSRGFIEHSSAKLHSAFLAANYRILNEKNQKDYGELQFNILYGNEKTGLAWNGVPSDSLNTHRIYNSCGEYYDTNGIRQYYDNETDNYQQTHYQLHYTFRRSLAGRHNFKLRTALHLTRGIGYYEEYQDDVCYGNYLSNLSDMAGFADAVTRKYLNNYFYGGTLNFEHTILQKYTWVLGGAVNRYQGKEYGTLEWLQLNQGIMAGTHWYDGTGDKRQYNVYAKFILNLRNQNSDNTLFYADLQYRCIDYRIGGFNANRFDVSQSYLWHFINPKIGVNHQWIGRRTTHEAYFTFSVANREPTRSDLTDADFGNRPMPETLYDFEAGYLLHSQKYNCAATAYFMYYTDQLVLTGKINSVGAAIMTNAPQSFRAGIELTSSYCPLRWLSWKINGTFSLNKILDYTEYVDDWDTGIQRENYIGNTNISFSPNIVAHNEFIFTPVKNFNITFSTTAVSRQYIDNSSRKEYSIDPYCVSNLQLSYLIQTKPISEIKFYFQVNNLFNAQYESNAWLYRYYFDGEEQRLDGYFPQAGVHFIGGITLKF